MNGLAVSCVVCCIPSECPVTLKGVVSRWPPSGDSDGGCQAGQNPSDLRIHTNGRFVFNPVDREALRHAISCRVTAFTHGFQRPTSQTSRHELVKPEQTKNQFRKESETNATGGKQKIPSKMYRSRTLSDMVDTELGHVSRNVTRQEIERSSLAFTDGPVG